MKRRIVLTVVLVLAAAGSAHARGSGIQITPDDHRVIIQKDVGNEHWSINFNFDDDTITGNVSSDFGAPVFLWCTATDVTVADIVFSCFAAVTCPSVGCSSDNWGFVGTVNLPKSFLGL